MITKRIRKNMVSAALISLPEYRNAVELVKKIKELLREFSNNKLNQSQKEFVEKFPDLVKYLNMDGIEFKYSYQTTVHQVAGGLVSEKYNIESIKRFPDILYDQQPVRNDIYFRIFDKDNIVRILNVDTLNTIDFFKEIEEKFTKDEVTTLTDLIRDYIHFYNICTDKVRALDELLDKFENLRELKDKFPEAYNVFYKMQ